MEINEISAVGYKGQGSSNVGGTGASVSTPTTDIKTEEIKKSEPLVIEEKNNAGQADDREKSGAASMKALKEAVEKINSAAGDSMEAKFGIHEKTNRVTIKMIDKKTQEVVKEFPADETLDLIAKAWELAGILVDERR